MLKHLRLQNIILVEQADIPFDAGLNILTGETGAGKSAIMTALNLALGERSDTGVIRRGCEKGIVEAVFNVEGVSDLSDYLNEAGIDQDPEQDLLIRREISNSGKSRIFINDRQVGLQLLRKIGYHLIQFVSQSANRQLFSQDYHREVLDLYGDLTSLHKEFKEAYSEENRLKVLSEKWKGEESLRLREIDTCLSELEELDEARLKEGEDEELFAEYTLLVHSEELDEKVSEINQILSGDKQPVPASLNRVKNNLDSVSKFDPSLADAAQSIHNAILEIQEVAYTLRNYQGSISHNPARLHEVNERLALINRLKRKYGSTLPEIDKYREQTTNKLRSLENREAEIEELRKQITQAEELTERLAKQLSEKRSVVATQFEKELTTQLHSLNMPKAKFIVRIDPQKRTASGDDKVEFYLQPNTGEHQIALREDASGGELSRVLLSLQTLLAGKNMISTLIFDEVDANIGGETAAIIAEKLREIGKKHQVICITHFPQVAARAHHHLQIVKTEKEGRTFTEVRRLDHTTRQKELERMIGGTVVLY